MKKLRVLLVSIGLCAGLLATTNAGAELGDACPSYLTQAQCNINNRPASTDEPTITNKAGAPIEPGHDHVAGLIASGVIEKPTPYSVPVEPGDTDPDDPSKLATNCTVYNNRDRSHDQLADRIDPLIGVLWRSTKIEVDYIYKACARQISSTEYKFWYDPMTVFFLFQMNEENANGEVPGYYCGPVSGFNSFRVDTLVWDKTKSLSRELIVFCEHGWTGNSGYVDFPKRQKMRYTTPFGFPKFEVVPKVVHRNFMDWFFPTLSGRLNPGTAV